MAGLGPEFVALANAPSQDGQRAQQTQTFLNMKTGHVCDAKGNTLFRMSPADDEKSQLFADYAASYAASKTARALGHPVLMPLKDGGERLVTMDLAPTDVHIDSALPNYAAGYRLGDPVADIAAPPVLAPKASDVFFTWDPANAFQRVLPTGGAQGAAVPEINPTLSNSPYVCKPFALGGFLPTETMANADAPLKPQLAVIKRIMNALLLEREIRVATLLQTSGNWDSSVVQTLAAGSQWDGGAAADPVKNLQDAIQNSYLPVTRVIMSEIVRFAFARSPAVQKFSFAKPDPSRPIDMAQLSAVLDLPPITVAKMKYQATPSSSNALTYVWGNHVVLVHEPEENPPTTQDDVATAYTFRWSGADQMVRDGSSEGGFLVRQFYDPRRGPRAGNTVIVTHNDAEVVTSKFVGGLILNAFQ